MSLLSNDIAIDLGTANTLVFVKGKGVLVDEPSVVALRRGNQEIVAFGKQAKEMVGRTPGEIVTVRPLRDGVIADFELAERMIRYFIRRVVSTASRFVRPQIAICIPSGVTEVEKRAVRDSAEHAGARQVYLIEEPMAAAIGVGLPIEEPVGSMIIDIGGGTTEIAVIAMNGIVNSVSIRVAGDEMTDVIIQYFKKNYNLLLGENTAEFIKCNIGSAAPYGERGSLVVKGRDLVSGIPKTLEVRGPEVQEALAEPVNLIIESTKKCLDQTPPELAADIVDRGIIISGGGAMLRGIDERLRRETNLPVIVAEDPMTCVVRGTGKILDDLSRYQKVLSKAKRY